MNRAEDVAVDLLPAVLIAEVAPFFFMSGTVANVK
jgi:hypothetical protein